VEGVVALVCTDVGVDFDVEAVVMVLADDPAGVDVEAFLVDVVLALQCTPVRTKVLHK